MHEQRFSCETVDGGCFAFAPLVGSCRFQLFLSNNIAARRISLPHAHFLYRFILLETSATGLRGNTCKRFFAAAGAVEPLLLPPVLLLLSALLCSSRCCSRCRRRAVSPRQSERCGPSAESGRTGCTPLLLPWASLGEYCLIASMSARARAAVRSSAA